eukprot:CAMPEP_0194309718 /NCGR_PEP_ID=MMETSP0171-20130528/6696_1 /TAXON_ID=218684 /ORGANISM="Corethron pennatum, Strain L29A3" /LENGTH=50 /DNA_ID=CAMNT_0039063023 /DNA_START=246 /DNA_END=398 /DNA_ORIENTATION=-
MASSPHHAAVAAGDTPAVPRRPPRCRCRRTLQHRAVLQAFVIGVVHVVQR